MWILYVFLGLLGLILFLIFSISFILGYHYTHPKVSSYEDVKKYHEDRDMYYDYDSLEMEEYEIKLRDGYLIYTRFFNVNPGSNKYIIFSHGFTANMLSDSKYFPIFRKLGYNIITYDQRTHGKNKKDKCTMSLNESLDLMDIINDTYKRYGDNIYLGLHGESMGGATVISSMRYNPNVKFIIADCPFANLLDVSYKGAKDLFHSPKFLVDLAGPISMFFFGWNPNKVRPIDDINNSKVPLLLCHGDSDKLINYKHSIDIYEAYNSYKEIYLTKGADHAESIVLDFKGYEEKVTEFLKNIKSLENN